MKYETDYDVPDFFFFFFIFQAVADILGFLPSTCLWYGEVLAKLLLGMAESCGGLWHCWQAGPSRVTWTGATISQGIFTVLVFYLVYFH